MHIGKLGYFGVATLVTGCVLNLGEFALNHFVLGAEWSAATRADGQPLIDVVTVLLLSLSTFAFAAIFMLLHVLLRLSSTTASRSAILAGLICWSLAYGVGWSWCYLLGAIGKNIYLVTLAWSLPEVLIGSLVGATYYENRMAPRRSA